VSRKPKGFTLVEILIGSAVSLALLVLGYAILRMTSQAFVQMTGRDDAGLQMRKAARHMQRDLQSASASTVLVEPVAGPGGLQGDGLSLLTTAAGNDARGPATSTASGLPYWQRNVVYYPIRPLGDSCAGAADADGYEDTCPHKVLIRKVIDSGDPTSPGGDPDQDTEEILETLLPYLSRPNGLEIATMLGEPGVTDVEVVATTLLTVRFELDPAPNSVGEVAITLRAYGELNGQGVGSSPLSGRDRTTTLSLSVFPRNAY
jgi:prepilin-type N-terminal cleavage/methylation domain-containing protein